MKATINDEETPIKIIGANNEETTLYIPHYKEDKYALVHTAVHVVVLGVMSISLVGYLAALIFGQ